MLNNPRLTPKDRGLIKGAIRKAFARSDLHESVIESTRVEHFDPNRPRVKNWSYCQKCGVIVPTYTVDVDHKDPVIPVDTSFEEMGADLTVNRTWCDRENLWGICEDCHDVKTGEEREARIASQVARGLRKPPKRKRKK